MTNFLHLFLPFITKMFILFHLVFYSNSFIYFVLVVSLIVSMHALLNVIWMLYAWESPEAVDRYKSPKIFLKPHYSFSAIIPAKNEEKVIQDTILAINKINYPEDLKEIIIVCRYDDEKTIEKVNQIISQLGKNNIKLLLFSNQPENKPHALNIGSEVALGKVIVVFDAEDEPHEDIYLIANTLLVEKNADVIQAGIQLMDFRSHWYSPLNVLEYFFWFKSTLPFFANNGFIPLGGNSVFIKKEWIKKLGNWDESCLTEDADIGVRCSVAGAHIVAVYDEKHVTREETPHSINGFIKQRTRWKQGFIQVFLKGDWLKLTSFQQRFLAGYVFFTPFLELLLFFYIPLSLFLLLYSKLPVVIAMITLVPLYLVALQIVLYIVGLYIFAKDYRLKYPFFMPLIIILTFFPFQILLGFSTFRAMKRLITGQNSWENTEHLNIHRQPFIT